MASSSTRRASSAFLVLLVAALVAAQDVPVREAPAARAADTRTIDEVAFGDTSVGAACREKGAVFAMTSDACPLSRKYAPKLARLSKALGLPVHVIDVQDEALRPLLRALGAASTTEVFLLDRSRTIVYRGALDDQYGIGYARAAPRKRYLADAVASWRAGKAPAIPATSAPGCWIDPAPSRTDDAAPTYHGTVAEILQRNCQACHRKGESAPFPLESYADARAQRDMIGWVVRKRLMPPWFAGPKSHAMANDRRLSEDERRDVIAWIAAGCQEGDPADAPAPRRWPQGWRIGAPHAVFETPRAFAIPAEGTVKYVHVAVPTGLKQDRWVQAMEIRSTAPQNVHHVLVFLRYPKGHPRYTRRPADRHGLGGYFAGMVPGQSALTYPAGQAKRLPAGAILLFQIHYTTNGKPAHDVTKLGLRFADGAPRHEVTTTGIFDTHFEIPADAPRHPVTARVRTPFPIRVLGFMPHMHLRGTAFRYELVRPDGVREVLLDVPRYDFNWQLYYRLDEPVDVPAGATLVATGWYDNSPDNPANPDPTGPVRYGEQTWEEMMIGYVDWHRR